MKPQAHNLIRVDDKLCLQTTLAGKSHLLSIDFTNHKLKLWSKSIGKKHPLAKSLGLFKRKDATHVLDATAGLGKDSFLMASLGAKVTMVEQATEIYSLLNDALVRLHAMDKLSQERLVAVIHSSALNYMQNARNQADVVYFDPMFPVRKKTALVKKEMQILQQIANEQFAAEKNLESALEFAKERVVVKRPINAAYLTTVKPSFSVFGKSLRYDVYLCGRNSAMCLPTVSQALNTPRPAPITISAT